MLIKHLFNNKTLRTSQNGSCEFIFLLAVICADETALMLVLIYQRNTYNLQDIWLEDFDHSSEKAYFVVSKKSWINKELRFLWLLMIFEPATRAKAGNIRRILIVDGHSSHLNMRFINYCDEYNIVFTILFPHSMH